MSGVYNSVAPDHRTNASMTKAISRKMSKPLWLPNIPSKIIELVMGERACLILKGSRVSCEKIERTGFEFSYNDLEKALSNLIQK